MGMGAGDYQRLQNAHERAATRGYRWTRNGLIGLTLSAAFLYADTQTTFIRDTVQRVTGSNFQSVPYVDRLEAAVERGVSYAKQALK